VGSIPNYLIVLFFNLSKHSSTTMAMVSSDLAEMCTRNLPEVKGRQALKADNIAVCEAIF
jgi:hypothetical protein